MIHDEFLSACGVTVVDDGLLAHRGSVDCLVMNTAWRHECDFHQQSRDPTGATLLFLFSPGHSEG